MRQNATSTLELNGGRGSGRIRALTELECFNVFTVHRMTFMTWQWLLLHVVKLK